MNGRYSQDLLPHKHPTSLIKRWTEKVDRKQKRWAEKVDRKPKTLSFPLSHPTHLSPPMR